LIQTLRQGHYDVHLNAEEMDRLITWVDLNGPYYPSYAARFRAIRPAVPLSNDQFKRLKELTGVDMAKYGGHEIPRGMDQFRSPGTQPDPGEDPDQNGAAYRKRWRFFGPASRRYKQPPW